MSCSASVSGSVAGSWMGLLIQASVGRSRIFGHGSVVPKRAGWVRHQGVGEQ